MAEIKRLLCYDDIPRAAGIATDAARCYKQMQQLTQGALIIPVFAAVQKYGSAS